MFLEQTMKRNPKLLETAFLLHQKGKILPDSYVIDMDILLENAGNILDAARREQVMLFFMLKQLGRNPYIARELLHLGYEGAVPVDFRETLVMQRAGVPIGNVGHLVQLPDAQIEKTVAYGPRFITVYSLEKMEKINAAAKALGVRQQVLLRVHQEGDEVYSGQTAGFSLEGMARMLEIAKSRLEHLEIRGITSFPCYLYDKRKEDIAATHNLRTVMAASEILKEAGIAAPVVNTPSTTCVHTIQKMSIQGGNCGEPGHGLTGTTPMHAEKELEEKPAVAYVSEISHNFQGKAFCYGGGYYRRSHVSYVLVGKTLEGARKLGVYPPSAESIDYHFEIPQECQVGAAAVMAFRFQIFVTRSDVVLVKGIQTGNPRIIGIYDSLGNERPE